MWGAVPKTCSQSTFGHGNSSCLTLETARAGLSWLAKVLNTNSGSVPCEFVGNHAFGEFATAGSQQP